MWKKYRNWKNYRNFNKYSFSDELYRYIALILFFIFLPVVPYLIRSIDFLMKHPEILWGTMLFLISIIVGIFYGMQRWKNYLQQRKNLSFQRFDSLMRFDWREFEEFIESILKDKGFNTILGAGVRDGGVDVTAILSDKKYFIQCKHYKDDIIGVDKIRELNGVMNGQIIPAGGIFVTTTYFSIDAVSEAKRYGIELWDKNYLKKLLEGRQIQESGIEHNSEYGICEKCGGKLLQRTAHKGSHVGEQFLGCENYPTCTYIKKL